MIKEERVSSTAAHSELGRNVLKEEYGAAASSELGLNATKGEYDEAASSELGLNAFKEEPLSPGCSAAHHHTLQPGCSGRESETRYDNGFKIERREEAAMKLEPQDEAEEQIMESKQQSNQNEEDTSADTTDSGQDSKQSIVKRSTSRTMRNAECKECGKSLRAMHMEVKINDNHSSYVKL